MAGRSAERRWRPLSLLKGRLHRSPGQQCGSWRGGRADPRLFTIRGCVDAQVVVPRRGAENGATGSALADSARRGRVGPRPTCGGTLRVLVEPVRLDAKTNAITLGYDVVRRAVGAGQRAVLIAQLPGSTNRLVVHEDGSTTGTLATRRSTPQHCRSAGSCRTRRVVNGASRRAGVGRGALSGVYAPPRASWSLARRTSRCLLSRTVQCSAGARR